MKLIKAWRIWVGQDSIDIVSKDDIPYFEWTMGHPITDIRRIFILR